MSEKIDDLIKKYIAKKVIHDILNNVFIDEEFCNAINTNNYTSFLRAEIAKAEYQNQLGTFADIISMTTNTALKELCILCCKSIINNEDIKKALFHLYKTKISLSLIYTMLDYPNLTIDYHKCFFEYIKKYWTDFENESKHYNSRNVIDIVEQRIESIHISESNKTPASKHWIYWCALLHSNDHEGVEYFIQSIQKDEGKNKLSDEFKKFREEVLEYIINKNRIK